MQIYANSRCLRRCCEVEEGEDADLGLTLASPWWGMGVGDVFGVIKSSFGCFESWSASEFRGFPPKSRFGARNWQESTGICVFPKKIPVFMGLLPQNSPKSPKSPFFPPKFLQITSKSHFYPKEIIFFPGFMAPNVHKSPEIPVFPQNPKIPDEVQKAPDFGRNRPKIPVSHRKNPHFAPEIPVNPDKIPNFPSNHPKIPPNNLQKTPISPKTTPKSPKSSFFPPKKTLPEIAPNSLETAPESCKIHPKSPKTRSSPRFPSPASKNFPFLTPKTPDFGQFGFVSPFSGPFGPK